MIGLAPMDGVTDHPFRQIVDIYGHPDIMFTEFVSAEAVSRKSETVMRSLQRHKTKTPIIAQIFGVDPDTMYQAATVIAELDFDGVDINMGCPDKTVVHRGGGAALIKNPKLAQQCVLSVKKALKDYFEKGGKSLFVSVKTRIGFDSIITDSWILSLIEANPSIIFIHGRTAKKVFSGECHWDEIGKAAIIARKNNVILLGNGSITSITEAQDKIKQYDLDGILIGRAALGNPWIFADKIPTMDERIKVMRQHCRLFLKYRPDLQLMPMRKHLAWYCKGFEGAAELRNKLTKVTTMDDLNKILLRI